MTTLTKLLIGMMLVFASMSVGFAANITTQSDRFVVYQSDTTGEGEDGEKKEEEEEPDC